MPDMAQVTVTIYPMIDGVEREFEALADVSIERAGPSGPPEVTWLRVTGEDMALPPAEFEAWCAKFGSPIELSAYDQAAIEAAA